MTKNSNMEKERNKLKGAYVERDVSWMFFNHRILQEAQKITVPILERMAFLGIYSNFYPLHSISKLQMSIPSHAKSRNKRILAL